MRKIFFLAALLGLTWCRASFSEDVKSQEAAAGDECRKQLMSETGGINTQQPSEAGQIIYQKEVTAETPGRTETHTTSITYLGLMGNSIKLKIARASVYGEKRSDDPPRELLLPLDENKETVLKVDPILYGHWSATEYSSAGALHTDGLCGTDPEELILKLIDGNDRITVTTRSATKAG